MTERITPQEQRDGVFLDRANKPSLGKEIADEASFLVLTVPIALIVLLVPGWLPLLPRIAIAVALIVLPPAFSVWGTYRRYHGKVDAQGVSLRVDADGIYMGGRRPRLVAWPEIKQVNTTWEYPAALGNTEASTAGFPEPLPILEIDIGEPKMPSWAFEVDELKRIRKLVRRYAPDVHLTGSIR